MFSSNSYVVVVRVVISFIVVFIGNIFFGYFFINFVYLSFFNIVIGGFLLLLKCYCMLMLFIDS